MNINTIVSYEYSPSRVQRIAATSSTNNDLLKYEAFINKTNQHERLSTDQSNLPKMQEEKLKELLTSFNKNDKFLSNGNVVDIWY